MLQHGNHMDYIRVSNESIMPPSTSDNSLNPRINYIDNAKIQMKLDGNWFKQVREHLILNFYIAYKTNLWPPNLESKFALLGYFFGTVKLT